MRIAGLGTQNWPIEVLAFGFGVRRVERTHRRAVICLPALGPNHMVQGPRERFFPLLLGRHEVFDWHSGFFRQCHAVFGCRSGASQETLRFLSLIYVDNAWQVGLIRMPIAHLVDFVSLSWFLPKIFFIEGMALVIRMAHGNIPSIVPVLSDQGLSLLSFIFLYFHIELRLVEWAARVKLCNRWEWLTLYDHWVMHRVLEWCQVKRAPTQSTFYFWWRRTLH